MNRTRKRSFIGALLSSWILWTALVLALVVFLAIWSASSLQKNVTETQAQFVADNVLRSAVQCYAIEGRYPSTENGIKYLEENYGLIINHDLYLVYYDGRGANLVPQIEVVAIGHGTYSPTDFSDLSPDEQISVVE